MITTTVGQLLRAFDALSRIGSLKCGDAAVRLRILRLLRVCRPEVETYHELRRTLITEHGRTRDPSERERKQMGPGPVIEVAPERLPEFLTAINVVESTKVTLHEEPLRVEMLDAVPDATAADIDGLGPLCNYESSPAVENASGAAHT